METIDIDGVSHRYYVVWQKMGFDEDEMHGFKGHLNFTKFQVPPLALDPVYDRPSRQPISKTINAMQNSNTGGTIYLGISDDAKVHGVVWARLITLSRTWRMWWTDTLHESHHSAPTNFVPVFNKHKANCVIRKSVLFDPRCDEATDVWRERAHSLRSSRRCWCDWLLELQCANGLLNLQYVVEIVIHAWDSSDSRNDSSAVGKMHAHPIHMNVYFV